MANVTLPKGVKFPDRLPGDFFVIEYDRDADTYVIHLDDDSGSSFFLGDGPQAVLRFTILNHQMPGIGHFGHRSIAQAREFGMVQGIWSQNRIINMIERKDTRRVFADEPEQDYDDL